CSACCRSLPVASGSSRPGSPRRSRSPASLPATRSSPRWCTGCSRSGCRCRSAPRRRWCSAVATPRAGAVGGELGRALPTVPRRLRAADRLLLQRLELGLVDDAPLLQVGEPRQLVGGGAAAAGARSLANRGVERGLLCLRLLLRVLRHLVPARDQ